MKPEGIHDRMKVAAGALSVREVAELTGFHTESVRRYLTRDMPSPEFVAVFCDGLGISADWLVHGRLPMRMPDALRDALARVPVSELFAAVARSLRTAEGVGSSAASPVDAPMDGATPRGV